MDIPTYARPIWKDGKVLNKGALPLWSGKGEVPAVGETVEIQGRQKMTATVTGYSIEGGWLMLLAIRSDGRRGNLAGTEIL